MKRSVARVRDRDASTEAISWSVGGGKGPVNDDDDVVVAVVVDEEEEEEVEEDSAGGPSEGLEAARHSCETASHVYQEPGAMWPLVKWEV